MNIPQTKKLTHIINLIVKLNFEIVELQFFIGNSFPVIKVQ